MSSASKQWTEQARSVFVTFAPAFGEGTPHVTPHVTPQVMQVLQGIQGEMTRGELMAKRSSLARARALLPRTLLCVTRFGALPNAFPLISCSSLRGRNWPIGGHNL